MSQQFDLLDLSITLTKPPAGSPPEAIASVTVSCSAPVSMGLPGGVLSDPITDDERAKLRWYLEEYWKWPYYEFAERGKQTEELLVELGRRLYKTVLGNSAVAGIVQAWRLQPNAARQVSILSDIPRALSLPWELLHDEQGFLALRTRNPVSIIRRLPQGELAEFSTPFEPPLRILLVTARPEEAGFLDPRGVARELLDEVEDQVKSGTVELEFLRPPTLLALRNRLKDVTRPVHILHFDGHGVFEGETIKQDGVSKSGGGGGHGKLAFEDTDGKLDLVEANKLAQVLQDSGVRLAVLDACQSAMGSANDVFSSVATRLIQGGVDAVVAMSTSVLMAATTRYFEAFYRELVGGISAPTAQERARQALHDDPRRHLQRRRRDEEGKPVELQDWWLPNFYQQRPFALRATRPSGHLDLQSASPERLSESMPKEPRYGFTGRSYELLQIERYLLHGKLVVVHGFGGNGKTALAREAADWLTRTKMYHGACFVSFEHGGDAALLLSTLGNFLGVYDGNYNPNDNKAALARLKTALKEKLTLVIADNLESVLPNGEAPLELPVRTQLWDVVLELSKMGAGVLLTSRDIAFDGKLERGKYVAHLALGGLWPEDAYTLASSLLNDLEIDRAKAPYAELRDLLIQLDHHPLSIQLVLPALEEYPIAKIRADFGALLPKFEDDTETGRNRSLLASLDYSLRRLSKEQRDLLPRLALFEGGASEDDLLAITEIPEGEWAKLRPALEQAALLTAEHMEYFTAPFLHFHPVLTPYLRSQPGADDVAPRERYAQRYCWLANYLYSEDDRNPQPVRALVVKELPNLKRALELLLEAGDADTASDMAESIARFLDNFGLRRELDEMRRRVGEAATHLPKDGSLTRAEFLRESGLGGDEWKKGNLGAAYTRFTRLLERVEGLPEGIPLGRGSYEHCLTIGWLARCLESAGRPAAAEKRFREALTMIDILVKQQPEEPIYIRQRGMFLTSLGDVLVSLGMYSKAQKAYEERQIIAKQQGDQRGQAVSLGQLGALALKQRDYSTAKTHYSETLQLFNALNEPQMEAAVWHQLGRVAEEQKNWTQAEQCYRESLRINEQLGNIAGTAMTCNQLAIITERSGRPGEAEGWYKRALELNELVQAGSPSYAGGLNNLADLLVNEVQAGHIPKSRLIEARSYAERALAIDETLDTSSEIWNTLVVLADIADMEGRAEDARSYHRRERETFAAFEGNRYHIDRQHGQLIADIAAAAKGDAEAQKAVEEELPDYEADGWHIADAIKRVWGGEREWHALVEDLDRQDALLMLRVLETIENPPEEPEKEDVLQQFEPLLQAIAVVAVGEGNADLQAQIETTLAELEAGGWHLSSAVQRIWDGERDVVGLTEGLDEQDAAVVRRALEMIERSGT